MRGMISGIKRMEIHDGEGLRTTVFFKGCPLRCVWCHNPESLSFDRQIAFFEHKCVRCGMCRGEKNERTAESCPVDAISIYGREYDARELLDEILLDEAFFKNGRGGVTLSGGECLAQPELAIEIARLLYERGISVYVDTCGYVRRESIERIIPYTDKFLYDVKAVDPDVHKRCTGRDNALILENLAYLCERGCSIEVRYPLVKGYNDGECESIARLLCRLPHITKIKVLQYHSFSASRYEALNMVNTLPNTVTEPRDVEAAVALLRTYGLKAVSGIE